MKKFTNTIGIYHSWRQLLLKMKLTITILLIGFLSVSASSYSQNAKLDLSMKNNSIVELFREIEEQSDFYFFFQKEELNDLDKVSVNFKNAKVTDILDEVLDGTSLNYKIVDHYIIVHRNKDKVMNGVTAGMQQKSVTGVVTDEHGEPLPGATVLIKGTSNGTVTKFDGGYRINGVNAKTVLQFSFIGMETKEVIVGSQSVIDVTLSEDAIGIEEVVAVGYGGMKKRDLAGSIGSVKAEQIESKALSNVSEALAGRVAGVQISSNDGRPGGGMNVRIRGMNSINGSSSPLYVVDDIIGVDPSTIDPSEIKSVEILKDASSTAIYGSQGANGVIIITTNKFGKDVRNEINVDYSLGISEVYRTFDMLNGSEYYQMMDAINPWSKYYKNWAEKYKDVEGVNWQDEILELGQKNNVRVSASGNSGKTQYYISGGYNDEKGVVKYTGYDRLNLKMNGQHKFSDKIAVRSSFDFSKQHYYGDGVSGTYGVYLNALKYAPHDPYVDIKESEFGLDDEGKPIKTRINPIVHLQNVQNDRYQYSYRLNGELEYKALKWVKFIFRGAMSSGQSRNENFQSVKTVNGSFYNGTADLRTSKYEGYMNDNLVFLDPKLGENHRLSAMFGFTQQGSESSGFSVRSASFVNDVLGVWGLPSGEDIGNPRVDKSEWTLHSFIGRLSYTFKERLLVTTTFRADGSSKFGAGNKWGHFPSIALGYRLNEVKAIKDLKVFSNLKLRASYGINGSQGIPPYGSLGKYSYENYTFDNAKQTTGVRSSSLENPALKWEKTAQTDIGLEVGLMKGKLNLELDYYHKKTSDLLYKVSMPYTSGYDGFLDNIGELENEGFEFSLNSQNIKKKDFSWHTSFNISFNKNEVKKLNDESTYKIIDSPWDYTKNEFIIRVGDPIGQMYGYVWDGVYGLEDFNYDPLKESYSIKGNVPVYAGTIYPGSVKFKDMNGDGIVDDKDKIVIGESNPDFFGGVSNSFSYKGLKLNIHFTYQYGGNVFNMTRLQLEELGGGGNKLHSTKQYWRLDNQDTTMPAAGLQYQGPSRVVSSRYIEDASYLKLKTVSLAYTIPKKISKKMHMKHLEFSLSGVNLWTLTDYSGADPEASTSGGTMTKGIDNGTYPTARIAIFSVKAKF
ncbi:SusC/RagA family TonB-linked outer membrane protein [Puteibacter caeruleilacunae]|nr:SusC/RagA family TonB-linked outer membrane protein [Puteibacter caeruleilacunae]